MFISRKLPIGHRPNRTTGIYGHLPKYYNWSRAYVGYLVLVLPQGRLVFWYQGNPYRHKIFEWQPTLY